MKLTVSITSFISTAFHQNSIPTVQEIKVDNDAEAMVSDVVVRITSEPPVLAPWSLRIESIEGGAFHYIRTPDLRLDAGMLRNLVEGIRAEVTIVADVAGAEAARHVADVHVLPPSHWGGLTAAPELLAAFVRPNDPAVDVVLHLAARKLAASGKPAAISGYTDGSRARAWDIAAAIWAVLADQAIAYVLPPASFERRGQKVRGPSEILARKTATCLDTALFYAACLEQAGLDPLVVFTEGHAFTGVWLERADFASIVIDDAQMLRKRRDLQDLVLVETTLLTQGRAGRFAAAVEAGAAQVEDGVPKALDIAVDIRRARQRQIRPLDLGDGVAPLAPPDGTPLDMALDEAPGFVEDAPPPKDRGEPIDRLDHWKRKLLDLTLKNKLLNFKPSKRTIELECPDPAVLEDLLAEGKRFRILPRAEVLTEADPRNAALHRERFGDDGRRSFLMQSLMAGDLQTDLVDADLEARLTDLYRLTKTAFEEGGSNILFLALGFLTWAETEGGRTSRAPVLLIPVSLQRTSVRAGFRLSLHEEEPSFNPTLIEMLRQDFELRMPEFEHDLPTDASGLAVGSILQTLRTHVRDLKGWEVTADVVLSTFSFTKFLMWKDLVERSDQLKESPVVRHLIDTPKHSYGDASDFPEAARLDADFHPRDIFAPLSADSSQLAAVLAAASGKDFVLFGPPGTGKSQTIANIISQCLASGRTVLFVSQKTAALEVVRRRLGEIGLGDYCLEVHSAKAQKSSVLSRLKVAWDERRSATVEDWDAATTGLGEARDRLNRLVSALHRRRDAGVTAYAAFGRVVAGRDLWPDLRLDWPPDRRPSLDRLAALKRLCRDIETALKAVGPPAVHPLRDLEIRTWTPDWRRRLDAVIAALAKALPSVGVAARSFAEVIGLGEVALDADTTRALRAFGDMLLEPGAELGILFLAPEGDRRRSALERLTALRAMADPLRGRLAADYDADIHALDLRALAEQWRQASASNIFLRGTRQAKVREALAPYARPTVPTNPGADLRTLIALAEIGEAAKALSDDLAPFGALWTGLSTDPATLAGPSAWTRRAEATIADFAAAAGFAPPDLRDYVIGVWTGHAALVRTGGAAAQAFAAFASAWEGAAGILEQVRDLAGLDAAVPPLPEGPDWIDATIERTARWRANLHRAQTWSFWIEAAALAREAGLGPIVDALERGDVAPADVERAFDLAFARWWADLLVTEDPVLRSFLAERHEDEIERFRRADDEVAALTRRIVRARLQGSVPLPSAFGSDPEWGALSRELTKKARHMPLRQLFGAIPTALTRLTPCMMMSPLSIAQYLPPGSRSFDVVIFDEASQIPAWDAVGAMARGRQAIIVGDPEQLPPTSVGERGLDDVVDGTDVEDQESILDECLASNIPSRRLEWHYRSRHESLIAFANHAYYKGSLVTFPSPQTVERAVHIVPVPGGVYARGKGRTNVEEARAVAREVVRRLKEPRFADEALSLGVVTFNGEQQRLIENLLDEEKRAHPEIEPFFEAARWHEPVFVKNLENVQGDERDIILFSVTFAADETGRPVGTISSLNRDGGHRRLNVAITRARREMAIFSSLRPEQIVLTGKGARGVRDFKHFLEFAERGPRALAEAAAPLDRGTDSPFEDAVKAELERRGWRVQTQIGVSAFRIDLGIVHPDAPGRYLAGIECDGATYHRSATARDRDRLRESVLRRLGWRIRRVWSTEWWVDADTAARKLYDRLDADLAEDRAAARAAEESVGGAETNSGTVAVEVATGGTLADPSRAPMLAPADQEASRPISADEPPRLYADAVPHLRREAPAPAPYRHADLATCGLPVDPSGFYEAGYRVSLRALVAHVIEAEAPLFEDVLIGRISAAHGFGRAGSRIRDVILAALPAGIARTEEAGRAVLWPRDLPPASPVPFREAGLDIRDHADIPLAELAGLARRCAATGATEEEVLRRMAATFGLGRLRDATRTRFLAAIRLAPPIGTGRSEEVPNPSS